MGDFSAIVATKAHAGTLSRLNVLAGTLGVISDYAARYPTVIRPIYQIQSMDQGREPLLGLCLSGGTRRVSGAVRW